MLREGAGVGVAEAPLAAPPLLGERGAASGKTSNETWLQALARRAGGCSAPGHAPEGLVLPGPPRAVGSRGGQGVLCPLVLWEGTRPCRAVPARPLGRLGARCLFLTLSALSVSSSSPGPEPPFQPSCPDKNKVHFNPTGSAFCPVSLVKPLFPNVGFLFRGFPAPAGPGAGTFSSCQPPAPSPFLGVRKDAVADGFSDPPAPSLNYEHWKRGQPEESVVFHSSLVV